MNEKAYDNNNDADDDDEEKENVPRSLSKMKKKTY